MTQTMNSKFIASFEQQNHPHSIQLFIKVRCEWSCYSGTINTSIQIIYHERLLSNKLSQDLRINI
jgi:hypothetical protein